MARTSRQANQEHFVGGVKWPASYFETLTRWTTAKRDEACGAELRQVAEASKIERQHEKAEEERAAAERQRAEREALNSAQAAAIWLETSTNKCKTTGEASCAHAPAMVDAEVRARCVAVCTKARADLVQAVYVLAKSRCIEPKARVCVVEGMPPAAIDELPGMTDQCSRACNAELDVMSLPPRAMPASIPPTQPRQPPPAVESPSFGGCPVRCCDGTCSGCGSVHRGCCSHHGGVC